MQGDRVKALQCTKAKRTVSTVPSSCTCCFASSMHLTVLCSFRRSNNFPPYISKQLTYRLKLLTFGLLLWPWLWPKLYRELRYNRGFSVRLLCVKTFSRCCWIRKFVGWGSWKCATAHKIRTDYFCESKWGDTDCDALNRHEDIQKVKVQCSVHLRTQF